MVVEFLGTLEHVNIAELISDNRFLTEGGVHEVTPPADVERAEITTDQEGALSVETAMERLPSIIAPETDINVVGGDLNGTFGVHIEFRGPVWGSRDIEPLYADGVTDLTGTLSLSTPTQGLLSDQRVWSNGPRVDLVIYEMA